MLLCGDSSGTISSAPVARFSFHCAADVVLENTV
jgi:hypothetical protein